MLDSKIEIYTSSGKLVMADESERQKWSKKRRKTADASNQAYSGPCLFDTLGEGSPATNNGYL
jgi:hypothetical protein